MKYEIKYREIQHSKITIEAKSEENALKRFQNLYAILNIGDDPTHSYIEEELEIDSITGIVH